MTGDNGRGTSWRCGNEHLFSGENMAEVYGSDRVKAERDSLHAQSAANAREYTKKETP